MAMLWLIYEGILQHATAISLMQVTCTLLLLNPSIDSIVIMEIAKQYSDKVGEEFLNLSRHTDL